MATAEEIRAFKDAMMDDALIEAADEAINKVLRDNQQFVLLARSIMAKHVNGVLKNAVELHYEGLENKSEDLYNETLRQVKEEIIKANANIGQTIRNQVEMIRSELGINKTFTIPKIARVDVSNQHYAMSRVLLSCYIRDDVMLVGAAGTGKGFSSRYIAKKLGLDYYAVSCSAYDMPFKFEGGMDAHGKFHKPSFRLAYEHGGVILIDEIDALNPKCGVVLNAAFSDGQYNFPDGLVVRHKDCVVICAANTYGRGATMQYMGRNALDAATLDRFSFIPWDYDSDLELRIAPLNNWTLYVQKIREWVFAKHHPYIVSMRASIDGGKLLMAGAPVEDVLESRLFKNWKPEHIEEAMKYAGQMLDNVQSDCNQIRYELEKGGDEDEQSDEPSDEGEAADTGSSGDGQSDDDPSGDPSPQESKEKGDSSDTGEPDQGSASGGDKQDAELGDEDGSDGGDGRKPSGDDDTSRDNESEADDARDDVGGDSGDDDDGEGDEGSDTQDIVIEESDEGGHSHNDPQSISEILEEGGKYL